MELLKPFKEIYHELQEKREKQFKGGTKHLSDFMFFVLNVAIDSSKGNGWKGVLFIIPVAIAVLAIVFWIVRIVV